MAAGPCFVTAGFTGLSLLEPHTRDQTPDATPTMAILFARLFRTRIASPIPSGMGEATVARAWLGFQFRRRIVET